MIVSTVAVAEIGRGVIGGFTDAIILCAIAAAAGAGMALSLVPGCKPQLAYGPHAH